MSRIYIIASLIVLSLMLSGCGTVLYKPSDTVLTSMSFVEAKSSAESIYSQVRPGANFKVHIDRLEMVSTDCYFNAMPIDIKDYGPLAGGGPYPMGSRYSVDLGSGQVCGYTLFKEYENAKAFANAVYILKNAPLQTKESYLKAARQREYGAVPVQQVLPQNTATVAPIVSDVDELPAIENKLNKNSYAIVIGIEEYRQKLQKADYAANDAKTITTYLTKALGYPSENIITLTNDRALKSDIEKYIERWLVNNVEKDSTVFIYYSGHGTPSSKSGDAYLVPYDGDPAFIEETGYSLKRLYGNLEKLQAKNVIVALDACFSGAGGKSVAAKGSRALVRVEKTTAKNIAVLTASADNQISSSYEEKGHGVFTYFLLKGIKRALEDDKNNKIALGELFNNIKPQIERISRKIYNNEQTPQFIVNDDRLKLIELREL